MFGRRKQSLSTDDHDNALTDGSVPSPDSFYASSDAQQQQVTPERYQRTSPVRYPSLPPVPEASEETSTIADRESISSGHTITDQYNGYVQQDEKRWSYPSSSAPYALPNINAGEPLNWRNSGLSEGQDPFTDGSSQSHHSTNDSYASNAPPTVAYVPRDYLNPQNYSHDSEQAAPSPALTSNLVPTDTGYSYQQSEWDHTNTSPIDHFRHDTEAYASGMYSRPSYRPPRSRSPTPAVDDEDYHIVGDTSVHYTGYSPSPRRQPQTREYGTVPLDDQGGQDVTQYEEDYGSDEDDFDDYDEKDEGYEYDEPEKQPQAPPPAAPYPQPPSTPVTTRHFGPAPVGRVLRRHKTKKRVQLTNGNLVIDLEVPPKLILPRKGVPEMMKTRYTAVTCDPDDFEKNGFFLRQNEMGRTTELIIVITMYNEDEILFCRTLYGVMRNIAHLCTRKNSRTWGQDAWKKVVVCIVADGRKKVHPRVLDCLTLLGVYQPGEHMINKIDHKPVTAHLFEYTASFGLDPSLHFKYPDKGIVPTQILFCMKEKNQKKINSHRWFFNAFAHMLQPNVCVLLDVGTRPGNKSIYHLWKAFDMHSNVAGACGEIAVYKGPKWSFLLNPLVAAQNFEYKIANILDKPTESLFGYISVLPGAFSAYRYIALKNDKYGTGPLASYFKGEVLHGRDTDIFTSNMYLAEDRILCFELVAKANSDWILKYVKSAIAETDVPDALPEFINQRRRWLNGSFFAATYAVAHFGQILHSGHSFGRKCILVGEMVYNVMNLIAAWFAIGNFFIFFIILTSSLESAPFKMPEVKYFNPILEFTMAGLVAACFLFSMGNKPKASPWKYMTAVVMYAAFMVYIIYCAVKCSIQAASQGGEAYRVMLFSIIITYGVYAFSSLLAFDPWHMFTSFIPYMLLSPSYINILNIYAFANLDDISWGTKQDTEVETDLATVHRNSNSQVDLEVSTDAADVDGMYNEALMNIKYKKPIVKPNNGQGVAEKEQAAKDYYANVRTNVLLAWVLCNGVLLAAILGGGDASSTFSSGSDFSRTKAYMTFILAFVAITSIVRFTGSTMYLVARIFTG